MSVHDLSNDVGKASIGDDFLGRDDRSLDISSGVTGWRA